MELSLGKTGLRQICFVLKYVYRDPSVNRRKIGEELAIDRAMVTRIFKYLVQENWLLEQSSARKSLPLVLNPRKIFAAGLEIQPESQTLVVTDIKGVILFSKRFKEVITSFSDFLNQVILPELEACEYPVSGLGIGIPGIVDSENGKLMASFPFKDILNGPFQFDKEVCVKGNTIPVYIDNDSRCAGWGHVAFNKELTPFFLCQQHFIDDENNPDRFGRYSCSSALFIDGKPCTGGHGCGGEMAGIFRVKDYRHMHIEQEERFAMKSDMELQHKYLQNTALNIACFANTLDVNNIYLSGFENMDIIYLSKKTREYFEQYRFYPELQDCKVLVDFLGVETTARGACGLVYEELFVRPCENENIVTYLIKKNSDN